MRSLRLLLCDCSGCPGSTQLVPGLTDGQATAILCSVNKSPVQLEPAVVPMLALATSAKQRMWPAKQVRLRFGVCFQHVGCIRLRKLCSIMNAEMPNAEC